MIGARVLVNATNLHAGGAVQVATSFICEIMREQSEVDSDLMDKIDFYVSSEVHNNVLSINGSIAERKNYFVEDTYAKSAFRSEFNKIAKTYDVIFTVFGPDYLFGQKALRVTGFAQPWIIYDEGYKVVSLFQGLKSRLKFWIQSLLFKCSDQLIVELDHVKKRLIEKGIAKNDNIHIVRNCLSSLYLDPSLWVPIEFDDKLHDKFKIGFLGRDYPHKNTNIIPAVKSVLNKRYNLDVEFYVTFTNEEWAAKSREFRSAVNNVGALGVAQCPSFYEAMDAIIFPSVLECFSATPLESMAMKKPLFASDRGFVKDVCGNFAYYFDPFDASSAAAIIYHYIDRVVGDDVNQLEMAKAHVISFATPKSRAEKYMDIISAQIDS